MRTITLAEAHALFAAQGVPRHDYATACPVCGTVQSMRSLVAAGADPDAVDRAFAFSCEGRLTGSGAWPSAKSMDPASVARRAIRGCDWTLGGLLRLHEVEVVPAEGAPYPIFAVVGASEAAALKATLDEAGVGPDGRRVG